MVFWAFNWCMFDLSYALISFIWVLRISYWNLVKIWFKVEWNVFRFEVYKVIIEVYIWMRKVINCDDLVEGNW